MRCWATRARCPQSRSRHLSHYCCAIVRPCCATVRAVAPLWDLGDPVAAAVAPPCDPVALSSAVVALTSDPYMPVRAPVASPVDSGVIGASPRNPVVAMREYVAVPEVPVAPACDPIPTSVAPPVEPVATALSTGSASSSSGSVVPPPMAAVPLAGPTDAAAAQSALPADGAGHSYRHLTALELAEQVRLVIEWLAGC
eukprot:jgi/Mesvir1/26073/Mv06798-RA.1